MKIMKKISFALLGIMMPVFAFAVGAADARAPSTIDVSSMCNLILNLQNVFKTLRILAFIGAAFLIMRWGWEYLSKGAEVDLGDVKKKGTALIVGFSMLLLVGIIASALTSAAGLNFINCDTMFNF